MKLLIALLVSLVFVIAPACGGSVTWNVINGVFSDGGTLTGWFTFNADTSTFMNWDLSVAGGNTAIFPPLTYSPADSTASLVPTPDGDNYDFIDGSRVLRFLPAVTLTDAGGTIALIPAVLGSYGSTECISCSPFRPLNGELSSTVPEPASFALVITALALGIGVRRRSA